MGNQCRQCTECEEPEQNIPITTERRDNEPVSYRYFSR